MRAQRQVHAEDKAVLGGLANQRVDQLDLGGKVFVVGDAALAWHQRLRAASGVAIVVVDVDQVDVAGDIQLTPAQLAHAHHPQLGALAVRADGCAVHRVELGGGLFQRDVQRQRGQRRHGVHHLGQGRRGAGGGEGGVAVQHHQALHHQLAQHPQRGTGGQPASAQGI